MTFSDAARALLELPAFATLTTLRPDGAPHTTIMWYRLADETLRMIAPASAAKVHNLARDPRLSVVVTHPENGYHYLELRGRAELVRDDAAARAELRRIAARYIGDRADAFTDALSDAPRVLIVVRPERVRHHAGSPPA